MVTKQRFSEKNFLHIFFLSFKVLLTKQILSV